MVSMLFAVAPGAARVHPAQSQPPANHVLRRPAPAPPHVETSPQRDVATPPTSCRDDPDLATLRSRPGGPEPKGSQTPCVLTARNQSRRQGVQKLWSWRVSGSSQPPPDCWGVGPGRAPSERHGPTPPRIRGGREVSLAPPPSPDSANDHKTPSRGYVSDGRHPSRSSLFSAAVRGRRATNVARHRIWDHPIPPDGGPDQRDPGARRFDDVGLHRSADPAQRLIGIATAGSTGSP